MRLFALSLLAASAVSTLGVTAHALEPLPSPLVILMMPPPAPPVDSPPAFLLPSPDTRTANNAIYLEAFGNGGFYSINYERIVGDFGVRAGLSYTSLLASSGGVSTRLDLATAPIVASYYYGTANHKLQLGLGVTLMDVSTPTDVLAFAGHGSGFTAAATGVVGYRYVPHDGGYDFGIGFTPLLGPGGFAPSGGIHLGIVF
jgi:hypothetical protein